MGLIAWIKDRLLNGQPVDVEVTTGEFFDLSAELYIRNLAFESAVNFISNTISKCEFKTFQNNKGVKGPEYYLWNIEPNKNQNSSGFIHKWISKLCENNECLIIEHNNELLVADSFEKKEYALYENLFTQVTVGDFTFDKAFSMSDVLFYQLKNNDVRKLINGMYESYGKLITCANREYQKSRGKKGILQVSTQAQGRPDFQESFNKLMNERFRTFFEANNAVLPLFDGYTYTDLGSKTYSNENSRDIRAMIDDIYDFTARAFNIPPALLRGDVANIGDEVINNYLTFCVDPLVGMLAEEINRKRYGYDNFVKGNYLKIDTTTVRHVDLLSAAPAADKLIGSACCSVNDIRIAIGLEPIDEDWANQHFITKNYSTIEEALEALEGGDVD